MVPFLLLIVPPITADHRADIVAEGLGDVEAGHSISGDRLSHRLDQDFLPNSGKKLLFPPLDLLPDFFFQVAKGCGDRPAKMDRQPKVTIRESLVSNVEEAFELPLSRSRSALAKHDNRLLFVDHLT
jgi:hypothetical protein